MQESLKYLKKGGRYLLRFLRQSPPSSPWTEIMGRSREWLPTRKKAVPETRVLCATGVGGHAAARTVDSLVATALWSRGAETAMLLCDGALPACEAAMFVDFPGSREFTRHGPEKRLCRGCYGQGSSFYSPLPFPTMTYDQFLRPETRDNALKTAEKLAVEECFHYQQDDLPLGEQARAGVLRFFGKATFEEEDPAYVEAVARRYLAGAMVAAQAAENAIRSWKPDVIVAHHGVYVPQGVLGVVARKMGVRVVNWSPSYRKATVIYSHGDTYHHTFLDEPCTLWETMPFPPAVEERLMQYLQERRGGKGDWKWVTPDRGDNARIDETARVMSELDLDPSKPTIGLLTNVLWDAQLYYQGQAFDDMLDWLFATLDYYIRRPETQLIVRVHPHEVKGGNRQPTAPEIRRRYPALPTHIKIVDRDSPYSTYALMDLCRAVLIYGTKTGVELAPFGIPVVAAGEAWIRNKGISLDVTERQQYLALLDSLPAIPRLSPQQILRAKKYAYHYFFRRMIPVASLDPESGFALGLRVREVKELLPGRDAGLDVICAGILNGNDFIYEPAS